MTEQENMEWVRDKYREKKGDAAADALERMVLLVIKEQHGEG